MASPDFVSLATSHPAFVLPCGWWHVEHSIPPRPIRCPYGLFRNDAACVWWHPAHRSSSFFARRLRALSSDEWIEWQLRQFTVSLFACLPACIDTHFFVWSWHSRQLSAPQRPTGFVIFSLSPPASMCKVPSPWHGVHTRFGTSPLFVFPRACGLLTNAFAWSWQSVHDATVLSAVFSASAGAAPAVPGDRPKKSRRAIPPTASGL